MFDQFRIALFLVAVIALASPVKSQALIEVDVEEDFSERVAVSGSMVVGAMLGALSGEADTSGLVLNFPAGSANGQACFSSKTRDGQYWSQAVVALPEGHSGTSKLTPKNGWQYLDELALYSQSDFAAIVRLGQACRIDPDAPILPVQVGNEPEAQLNIALNVQRAFRVSAQLRAGSDASLDGVCAKPEGDVRSTAFNYLCTFTLPDDWQKGEAELIINRRTRVGRRSDTVSLIIP